MDSFFEMVSLIFQNAGYIQAFRMLFEVQQIELEVYEILLIFIGMLIEILKWLKVGSLLHR